MDTEIITGEAVSVLAGFPADCVDLTVTSPPYDSLRRYHGYSFDFYALAKQLFRVTKPGCVVVWIVADQTVGGSETGTSFRQALYFRDECGFRLHDTMIYQRLAPPLTHRRYEQHFEFMFVLSKGRPRTFNPLRDPKVWFDRRARKQYGREADGSPDWGRAGNSTEKIKGNVWQYKVGGNGHTASDGFAARHPAPFPEALARDHIASWSNEGDLVLDPLCGSGTTGKEAVRLNRRFVGVDVSAEYCAIADQRIRSITGGGSLLRRLKPEVAETAGER